MKVGLVYDETYLKFTPSYSRPWFESFESPERLRCTMNYLERTEILQESKLLRFKPRMATDEEILRVHTSYLLQILRESSESGGGEVGPNSIATSETFEVAKMAAGGAIVSGETIFRNEVDQAFALIRPPGHHAGKGRVEGLCFLNNAAIMINHLRAKKLVKRVMVLDWDSHYCDGTAELYYDDPDVMVVSFHEEGFFNDGRGKLSELGAAKGIGCNINVPLPANLAEDYYLYAFDEIFEPTAKAFNPDLIVVSAGFDGHYADPVGNMMLISTTYRRLTERVLKVASDLCGGKIAFILEGGYNLLALPTSVACVLSTLLGIEPPTLHEVRYESDTKTAKLVKAIVRERKKTLSRYLDIF
ncbi:MAG: histone deacetylase [Candidatus Hodarchaeota archaeon]